MIDIENFVYQLFLSFGCDLNAELATKYDALRLGFCFLAASLMIYWTIKFLYVCCNNFFRGKF